MSRHRWFSLLLTLTLILPVVAHAQDADLSVTSIGINPSSPQPDQNVVITATVFNGGPDTVTDDFYVDFLIDGFSIGEVLVTGDITVGSSRPVTTTWRATADNLQPTITVTADSRSDLNDANRANNIRQQVISIIVPFPDYTVTDISPAQPFPVDARSTNFSATVRNIGGGTVRSSTFQWFIDGASSASSTVYGLDTNEERTFNRSLTFETGRHLIRGSADINDDISEFDEDNNDFNLVYTVPAADLLISDIYFEPAIPRDGESVSVYAVIQNLTDGGSIEDYNVRFERNGTTFTNRNIDDHIGYGQLGLAFTNSDFDGGTFSNWTNVGDFEIEQYGTSGEYFARSTGTTTMESTNFVLQGDIFTFRMKGNSGTFVRMRRATDDATLFSQSGPTSSYAQTIYWDIADLAGETVYLEVGTNSSGNVLEIDEISMGRNASRRVLASVPVGSFTAFPGDFNITITVDSSNEILETNEGNNTATVPFRVSPADYAVTELDISPPEQLLGADATVSATVENLGPNDTLRDADYRFELDGSLIESGTINPLDLGDSADFEDSFSVDRSRRVASFFADSDDDLIEANETNNDRNLAFQAADPDLTVTDIYWLPEDPGQGENITFYAVVENVGPGGIAFPFDGQSGFEVQYFVDGVSIGTSSSSTWIGLGARADAFPNSDFEDVNFAFWTSTGSWTKINRGDASRPNFYAISSTGSSVLTSPDFTVTDDVLAFEYYSTSTSNSIRVRDAASDAILRSFTNSSGAWRSHVFDLREFVGQDVYLQVSRSSGSLRVDSFRMGDQPNAGVIVTNVTRSWGGGEVGTHLIRAEVDPDNEFFEGSELNQAYEEQFEITPSDYVIDRMWLSPARQLSGRDADVYALVRNQGNDTGTTSATRFEVDGSSLGTDNVSGLDTGETGEAFQDWNASSGSFTALAQADWVSGDTNGILVEIDESNNTFLYDFNIPFPDLVIADLWFTPTNPRQGQTVTIYAEVRNQGDGGSVFSYDLNFAIDGEEIHTRTISDDIGFANVPVAFFNGDFDESTGLTGWASTSGFSRRTIAGGRSGYAYSDISSRSSTLRSNTFTLRGDFFSFRMETSSTSSTAVRLYNESGSALFTEFGGGSGWQEYVWDISDLNGTEVYVQVNDSSSGASVGVDDFRMGSSRIDESRIVHIASTTWTAEPGTHRITARVDLGSDIPELDELNNDANTSITIFTPDYTVNQITGNPAFAFGSSSVTFTATLENIDAGSSTTTDTRFLRNGSNQGDISTSGIAAGATRDISDTISVVPGTNLIRVIADVDDEINETDETNNDLQISYIVPRPDLEPVDIWWEPQVPRDGETVTFYAAISNRGPGGELDSYVTQFTLGGDSLGSSTVSDDINRGQYAPIATNADFELGTLNVLNQFWGTTSTFQIQDHPGNFGYYAASDVGSGTLESVDFLIPLDADTISFSLRGETAGSNRPTVRLRSSLDRTVLRSQQPTSESTWGAFIWDVTDLRDEVVYIEVEDTSSDSGDFIEVDDFRMAFDVTESALVGWPSRTWTAVPGTHNVAVEADTNDAIDELDELNQFYDENITVPAADYLVDRLRISPPRQLEGESATVITRITNQGPGATIRDSDVDYGVDGTFQETDSIDGLDLDENITLTADFTADYGLQLLSVTADADDDIIEADETNNDRDITVDFGRPDLEVVDIWWLPANPTDGQTVTFYAEIVNNDLGGTNQDYQVQFYIDGNFIDEDRIFDEVAFGQRLPGFTNADFADPDLNMGWTATGDFRIFESTGGAAARNRYWAGTSGSSATGTLRSENFTVNDSIITFRYKGSGTQVRLRDAGDDSILRSQSGESNSRWSAYVWDVSELQGREVYVEVNDSSTSSSSNAEVDDVTMGDFSFLRTSVAVARGTWTAVTGTSRVRATVDFDREIPESSELNQNYEEQISVGTADYIVTGASFSPRRTLDGRPTTLEATVKNIASGTSLSSTTSFFVNGSSSPSNDSIGGLDFNETTVAVVSTTGNRPGNNTLTVRADATDTIVESDETNNEFDFNWTLPLPDLAVREIQLDPPAPREGETVTLTGQFESRGLGGTTTFVRGQWYRNGQPFGSAFNFNNDIPLGQMAPAFTNSDLEEGSLNGWVNATSGDWALFNHPGSDEYYLGSRDRQSGTIESEPFIITDSLFAFRARGLSGTVVLRRTSDNGTLESESVNDQSNWDSYVWDLSDHLGEEVYLQVNDNSTSSGRDIDIDDVVMGDDLNASVVFSFPQTSWTVEAGRNTFRLVVDDDSRIDETNELNNDLQISISVNTPDYLVTGITTAPDIPVEGQTMTFGAQVKNQGAQTATSSRSQFFVDGNSIGFSSSTGGLDTNQTVTQSDSWNAIGGQHYVRAVADADNAINEDDEANNDRQITFAVPQADLVSRDISWTPRFPLEGQSVTFTTDIWNQGVGATVVTQRAQLFVDGSSIGSSTSADDANFGQLNPAFNNANFASGNFQGWNINEGNWTVETRTGSGQFYAASNDNATAVLESDPFTLQGDLLVFNARGSSSNRIDLVDVNDGSTIRSLAPESTSSWSLERFDITDLAGTMVVLRVRDVVSGTSGFIWVDNFRMGSLGDAPNESVYVTSISRNWTASPGVRDIRATVDSSDSAVESNELNNDRNETFVVRAPDLRVSNLFWEPAVPRDGEDVTVRALIENFGPGGSINDFDVRFFLDGSVLGTVNIEDDVQFGNKGLIHANGGFDDGDFQNWTNSGSWSLINRGGSGRFYARSTSTGTLVSSPFTLAGDTISFLIQGDDSVQVELVETASGDILYEFADTSSPDWRAIVWDISDLSGTTANIRVRDQASSGTVAVDDFQMGTSSEGVFVAIPSVSWQAIAGVHDVRAEVDFFDDIVESDEANNDLNLPLIVPASDYETTNLTLSPPIQLAGKGADLIATIRNNGPGGQLRDSEVRWQVDGNFLGTRTISDFDANESVVLSRSWTTEPGPHYSKVTADFTNLLMEGNEFNNDLNLSFDIPLPDLNITDIWWTPENPGVGQTVTFYARVENHGIGGTTQPYTVRFDIDDVTIGNATVSDEVPLSRTADLFSNADFDRGDFTNWADTNTGFRLLRWGTPLDAWRVNSGTSNVGTLRSQEFTVNDAVISFKWRAGNGARAELVEVDTNTTLISIGSSTSSGLFDGVIWDVRPHVGKRVRLELIDPSGSAFLWADEFRTGVGNDLDNFVIAATPSRTWSAVEGIHRIKARVDINFEIPESNESNQNYEEIIVVDRPDYFVEGISLSPREQLIGRTAEVVAQVGNQGNSSGRSSSVRFFVESQNIGTDSIPGVATGEFEEARRSWTVRGGTTLHKAYADSSDQILELNENNNDLNQALFIPLPDLGIASIRLDPPNPQDGEQVTINAEVVNRARGGDTSNFDVEFLVDGQLIGTSRVTNDIALGQKGLAFPNSDFENDNFTGWRSTSGFSIDDAGFGNDRYHAVSSRGSRFFAMESLDFNITAPVFQFDARGDNGCYVELRLTATDEDIYRVDLSNDNNWQTFVADTSDYLGREVYLYVYDGTSSGEIRIDDVRMGADNQARTVVGVAQANWTAIAGEYILSVLVDTSNEVEESNENNNGLSSGGFLATDGFGNYTTGDGIDGQGVWTGEGPGAWVIAESGEGGLTNNSGKFLYYDGTGTPTAVYNFTAADVISTLTVEFEYVVQNNADLTIEIGPNPLFMTDVTSAFNLTKGGAALTSRASAELDAFLDTAAINRDVFIRFTGRALAGNDNQIGIDDLLFIYNTGNRPTPIPSPTPTFTPTPSPTPTPTPGAPTAVDYTFREGWNAFSLAAYPSQPQTISSLASEFTAQGLDLLLAASWDEVGWSVWTPDAPFNDFTVEMTRGYFLYFADSGTYRQTGLSVPAAIPVTFNQQWSLVGFPFQSQPYTASTLLEEFNLQTGFTPETPFIFGYNGGWQAHVNGLPYNDFVIDPRQGYFLWTAEGGVFLP